MNETTTSKLTRTTTALTKLQTNRTQKKRDKEKNTLYERKRK